MQIKEINEKQPKLYFEAKLKELTKRHIESNGKDVLDLFLYDESGEARITIWPPIDFSKIENIAKDTELRVESGFCNNIYEEMRDISLGFFGKLMKKVDDKWEIVVDMKEEKR